MILDTVKNLITGPDGGLKSNFWEKHHKEIEQGVWAGAGICQAGYSQEHKKDKKELKRIILPNRKKAWTRDAEKDH